MKMKYVVIRRLIDELILLVIVNNMPKASDDASEEEITKPIGIHEATICGNLRYIKWKDRMFM